MRSPASPEEGALAGANVLVTRPSAQARELVAAIRSLGGEAIAIPAIEIEGVRPSNPLAAPGEVDVAIFTSPNAVAWSFRFGGLGSGPGAVVLAVGPSTARALAEHGVASVVAPPRRHDSEGLLDLPELRSDRVRGRRVVVVKGEGGRHALRDGLVARGARVEALEVYRRVLPGPDAVKRLRAALGGIDMISVTSLEILDNLLAMAGDRRRVICRPIVVASHRIEAEARRRGCERVVAAGGAGTDDVVAALDRLWRELRAQAQP